MNQSTYSREAYASIAGHALTDEQYVLDYITWCGFDGSTCDQAEAALGLTHQNCSARFNGLVKRGMITLSGEARKSRSGRRAGVYVSSKLVTKPLPF
jgi:hypothetical protein